jgi:hypothetical protein
MLVEVQERDWYQMDHVAIMPIDLGKRFWIRLFTIKFFRLIFGFLNNFIRTKMFYGGKLYAVNNN